ncbi:MAG: metal ABC transporter solute-binding protein, Zn/Mn family [Microbacterium sp.]
MTRRILPVLPLAAVAGLALAGCASSGDAASDDGVSIVASTSVYADLAQAVVGDAADVEAVIDSATADPHEYEATVQDQKLVTDADLVVSNGGGYDHYMDELVEAAGIEHSVVAVEYNHDYPDAEVDEHDDHDHDHGDEESEDGHDHEGHDHIEGFNEHVWYDPHTIVHVVEAIAEEAGELLPDEADAFEENAAALIADIEGLEGSLEEIAAEHEGGTVAFTEPVGGYLTSAAGLEDVTAEGFAEAVEEGQEVAPATLLKATTALEDGDVDVLVVNPQTSGPETESVTEAASTGGVPIVEYAETLPDGETYVSWMQSNIDALQAALDE